MSEKMTCPACDSHTSAIYEAYGAGRPCPYCGLPAEVAATVLEAARRGADADLIQRYQAAEVRATEAEAEAAKLRRHLRSIRQVVTTEPADYPPDW